MISLNYIRRYIRAYIFLLYDFKLCIRIIIDEDKQLTNIIMILYFLFINHINCIKKSMLFFHLFYKENSIRIYEKIIIQTSLFIFILHIYLFSNFDI
jgi:hypothetical protein